MKLYIFVVLIFISGCSGKPNVSTTFGTLKTSGAQAFLSDLKDSLVSQYNVAGPEEEKQKILDKYRKQLQVYLVRTPLDSMRVTIDEVITKGLTVTTKSHFSSIEFKYGLTFSGSMSPRIDSIYEFMKSLKGGSDILVNFSFTGTCEVNRPDSAKLSTFRIYAFPVPLQYTGKKFVQ
jgi:hypothetical protein